MLTTSAHPIVVFLSPALPFPPVETPPLGDTAGSVGSHCEAHRTVTGFYSNRTANGYNPPTDTVETVAVAVGGFWPVFTNFGRC